MPSAEQYPVVLRCDGSRTRPSRVVLMANGVWRVGWIGGLVSLYRADPRKHLLLGYDPSHLRWWRPPEERADRTASRPIIGLGR